MFSVGGTTTLVSGLVAPCWISADIVTTLATEPGSNTSESASSPNCSAVAVPGLLGSKVCEVASARTAPLRGFITTAVPSAALVFETSSSIACCAAYWILLSIVVSTDVPLTAACSLMPVVGIS